MKKEKNKKASNELVIEEPVLQEVSIAALYKECEDYNSPKAVSKRKSKRFWTIFGDVITFIILFILCYGVVVVNLTKQKGEVPFIAGYALEYVQTGSMEPTLPTGSVILAKEVNNLTIISQGDIITFKEGYDRSGEVPETRVNVTHRVYEISDVNGVTWYTTKGDNNNAPDQYQILFEDIVSTFVRRIA